MRGFLGDVGVMSTISSSSSLSLTLVTTVMTRGDNEISLLQKLFTDFSKKSVGLYLVL